MGTQAEEQYHRHREQSYQHSFRTVQNRITFSWQILQLERKNISSRLNLLYYIELFNEINALKKTKIRKQTKLA
jgi:hypothetical protein